MSKVEAPVPVVIWWWWRKSPRIGRWTNLGERAGQRAGQRALLGGEGNRSKDDEV